MDVVLLNYERKKYGMLFFSAQYSFPFLLIALSGQRRGAQMICVWCWKPPPLPRASQSWDLHNSPLSSGFRLLGFILGTEELPFFLVISQLHPAAPSVAHTQSSQLLQELPPALALAPCPLLMVHFPSGSPLGTF